MHSRHSFPKELTLNGIPKASTSDTIVRGTTAQGMIRALAISAT